jgi:hypothetical protein
MSEWSMVNNELEESDLLWKTKNLYEAIFFNNVIFAG